jgi:putative membrane protein
MLIGGDDRGYDRIDHYVARVTELDERTSTAQPAARSFCLGRGEGTARSFQESFVAQGHLTRSEEEMIVKSSNHIGLVLKFGAMTVAALALAAGLGMGEARASPSTSHGAADDAQIVQYVLDLDRAEVQTAEAIMGKLSDDVPVWRLALRTRVDHSNLDRKFRSLRISPQESQLSRQLAADSDENIARLRGLSGSDLEQAYLESQISFHKSVVEVLDRELLPNAKNDALKARLLELRLETARYLDEAEFIQTVNSERAKIDKQG